MLGAMDEVLDAIDYTLIGTVPKADDLEIAVRVAQVADERVIDVRDYVPSIDFYGRGITVPVDGAYGLAQLISDAARSR